MKSEHPHILNVYYTIDTEFWPRGEYATDGDQIPDFRRDIDGVTPQGEFGLEYQLKAFAERGLRAVCFVEALHAQVLGTGPLQKIVDGVRDRGHDVELHVHPEWLARMPRSLVPGRTGLHMHQFTEDEQSLLLSTALTSLRECGVSSVHAFRAGNYGADRATLRALARNGIRYDSSYNAAYVGEACRIECASPFLQPCALEGVVEVPISFFADFRGLRHAQLSACSSAELESALWEAWKRKWSSFVIVSHSFETLVRSKERSDARANRVVIGRFQRLCRFLEENRDKFRTSTFSDATPIEVLPPSESPISMRPILTMGRYVEQARQRLPF